MTTLRARHDLESEFLTLGCSSEKTAHAWSVDCDWLLRKNVLLRFHCRREVNRAESWRRCEDDHIAICFTDSLVGVETSEEKLRRDFLDASLHESSIRARDSLCEEIAERNHFDCVAAGFPCIDRVEHRTCAATTTADNGDLQLRRC